MHRRNHGKALLSLEGALDHGLFGFKALTKRALALLPLFGFDVDGQNHDVDGQTHHDDGRPPSFGVRIAPNQSRVHPILKRRNQKRVDEIEHRLPSFLCLRFVRRWILEASDFSHQCFGNRHAGLSEVDNVLFSQRQNLFARTIFGSQQGAYGINN